ncbi:MAG: TIGR00282 family metallophosphoesterase [Oscillospiraceae bacterium]|nr:TIGR00282 family metallophosphoesterase [Oscillospiraceae bacterium]
MNVLMIGDVVGEAGCACFRRYCPQLKQQYQAELVIVNGENSAKGNGITPQSANALLEAGADVITTGNHCFRRRCDQVFDHPRILRPANYPEGAPGSGLTIVDLGRVQIAVLNLMGTAFMEPLDNPFSIADALLKTIDTPLIFVDFHAEATAEKRALGYYLAGRVSAVVGTHTHVQTADEECLKGATAYLSDLGMTGPADSVLGIVPAQAVDKQRFHRPVTFTEADGPCILNGACISVDRTTGKATAISRIFLRESHDR